MGQTARERRALEAARRRHRRPTRRSGDRMIVQAIAFWVFAIVAVIPARWWSPTRTGLFGAVPDPDFFKPPGLFVLLGAEFLAMMLIVVYVGAVAVLSCSSS